MKAALATPRPEAPDIALAVCGWLHRIGPVPSRIVVLGGAPALVAGTRRLWPHARLLATDEAEDLRAVALAAGADHFVATRPIDLPPVLIESSDLVMGSVAMAVAPALVRHVWSHLHERAALALVLPLGFLEDERQALFVERPADVVVTLHDRLGLFTWRRRRVRR